MVRDTGSTWPKSTIQTLFNQKHEKILIQNFENCCFFSKTWYASKYLILTFQPFPLKHNRIPKLKFHFEFPIMLFVRNELINWLFSIKIFRNSYFNIFFLYSKNFNISEMCWTNQKRLINCLSWGVKKTKNILKVFRSSLFKNKLKVTLTWRSDFLSNFLQPTDLK